MYVEMTKHANCHSSEGWNPAKILADFLGKPITRLFSESSLSSALSEGKLIGTGTECPDRSCPSDTFNSVQICSFLSHEPPEGEKGSCRSFCFNSANDCVTGIRNHVPGHLTNSSLIKGKAMRKEEYGKVVSPPSRAREAF